jgi:hypothetical protein
MSSSLGVKQQAMIGAAREVVKAYERFEEPAELLPSIRILKARMDEVDAELQVLIDRFHARKG